jgi:dTDP-4-amino-4,6-dideoxygalactose transaminase
MTAEEDGVTPPFLPFARPDIDDETIDAVVDVLRSGWLATGRHATAFEDELSDYLGGRPVRVTTSATEALEIALKVCGVGPGDEVVTPALSFAATANVILRVGARPVFVDVDLDTRLLDLDEVEAVIGPQTQAILPVHFAGLVVDLDRLYEMAHRRGVRVVEDAAHAIGATWRGTRVGATGDIVVFSFHPNKNMTSIEGGALSLPDETSAALVEQHRFHGIERRDGQVNDVVVAGGKHNLSDVAARVGRSQLRRLDQFNQRRAELAHRYLDQLGAEPTDPPLRLPAAGDAERCWHLFAPLLPVDEMAPSREAVIAAMAHRGVGVGVHYPALHLFSIFQALGYRAGDYPNAERVGRSTLTLPLFPTMADQDVDRVCAALRDVLES